jgi:hypothetical protein
MIHFWMTEEQSAHNKVNRRSRAPETMISQGDEEDAGNTLLLSASTFADLQLWHNGDSIFPNKST